MISHDEFVNYLLQKAEEAVRSGCWFTASKYFAYLAEYSKLKGVAEERNKIPPTIIINKTDEL